MRQAWLVLAMLTVSVSDAAAKHVSCSCPSVVTVPERGATNVPLNAKLWSFGSPGPHTYTTSDGTVIPNVRVEAPQLQPNQPYKNDGWIMDFTTSGETDDIAPAAPLQVYASIMANADGTVDAISVSAGLTHDTALVRVDVRDASGAVARLLTTPRRMFLCQPGLRIAPGKLTVEVRALDVAGNQSPPATTDITSSTLRGPDPDLDCSAGGSRYERRRHGHGFEVFLLLLGVPAFLLSWLVIVLVRRAGVKRHLAESISLLEAEAIARRLSRWQVLWSGALIGVAIAMQFARDLNDLAILLVPFIFSSVGQLFLQRRALSLLDAPNCDAVRRGPWLVVSSLRDSVTVRASDTDFVVAKRSSIPKSVAQ
jgi:hypothetical protein